MNSFGATEVQNAVYMDSLKAKTSLLKAEFEKLVLGEGGLQNLAKSFVDIGTQSLKLINSLGGLKSITVVIGAILVSNLINPMVNFGKKVAINAVMAIEKLIFAFQIYKTQLASGATQTQAFKIALDSLNVSISTITVAINACLAIFSGLFIIYQRNKQQIEEQKQAIAELGDSLSDVKNKYDSLIQQLSNENISRDELNQVIENNLSAYQNEFDAISDINEAREYGIGLIKAEKEERLNELIETGQSEYEKAKTEEANRNEQRNRMVSGGYWGYGTEEEVLQQHLQGYYNARAELQDLLDKGEISQTEYNWRYDEFSKSIAKVEKKLKTLREEQEANQQVINQYENALKSVGKVYDETTGQIREMNTTEQALTQVVSFGQNVFKQSTNEGIEGLENFNQLTNLLIDDSDSVDSALRSEAEAFSNIVSESGATNEQLEEASDLILNYGLTAEEACRQVGILVDTEVSLREEFLKTLDSLTSLQSNYDTLTKSVIEYNTNGSLSASTLKSLLSLGDEYIAMLSFENGQLALNEDAFQRLANSEIDQAEAEAVEMAQTKLSNLAHQTYNDTLVETEQASEVAIISAEKAGTAIKMSAKDALESADSWATAWGIISREYVFRSKEQQKQADEIEKTLYNTLQAYESLRGNIGHYADSLDQAKKSTKSLTDALKENVDALKAQQDAVKEEFEKYESALDYIKDKVKDYVDTLKDQKDAEKDLIDQEIDALEHERDARDDAYSDQIDQLKEQNKALEQNLEYQKLLDDLAKAKAKNVKVYKEGQGFVYDSDNKEVDKAQKALDEFNFKKQYEEQLKTLEKAQKESKKSYDKQIEDLKDYKKEIERNYDEQIKYYEDWVKGFETQVNDYENEQNRLFILEKTGVDFESDAWQERLDNLGNFITEYSKKQKELSEITEQYNTAQQSYEQAKVAEDAVKTQESKEKEEGFQTTTNDDFTGHNDKYAVFEILNKFDNRLDATKDAITYKSANPDQKDKFGVTQYEGGYVVYALADDNTYYSNIKDAQNAIKDLNKNTHQFKYAYTKVSALASGVANVTKDQIAITGENPNKEIVLGSQANGVLTHIDSGGGVVNAKSTSTLAGILNTLGSFNLGGAIGKMVDNKNMSTQITIGNITLPNVKNGNDFVSYLQNFNLNMTQKSY